MRARTLAIDPGTKRTGAAITDELGITAQPVGVRNRTGYKSDLKWVRELMERYDIERILIGCPINLNSTKGARAIAAETFARKLAKDVPAEVILWDERFTTAQAERVLIDADLSRKKRKKSIDQMAAQLILAHWLDYQSNMTKNRGEK